MVKSLKYLMLSIFMMLFIAVPVSAICEASQCFGCDVQASSGGGLLNWGAIKIDVTSIEDNVVNYTRSYVEQYSAYAQFIVVYNDTNGNVRQELIFSAPSQFGWSTPTYETFDFDTLSYDFRNLVGFKTACYQGVTPQTQEQYYDMSYFENDGSIRIALVNDRGHATSYYPYGGWGNGTRYEHVTDNVPIPADYVYFNDYITPAQASGFDLVVVRRASNIAYLTDIIEDDSIRAIFDTEMLQTLGIVSNVAETTPISYGFVPVASGYNLMDGLSANDTFIVNRLESFYLDIHDYPIMFKSFDTNTTFTATHDIEDLAVASNDTSEIVIGMVKHKDNDTYSTLFTTLGDFDLYSESAIQWSSNYSILFNNILSPFWQVYPQQEATINWDTYIDEGEVAESYAQADISYGTNLYLTASIRDVTEPPQYAKRETIILLALDSTDSSDDGTLYLNVDDLFENSCSSLAIWESVNNSITANPTWNEYGGLSGLGDFITGIPLSYLTGWQKIEIPLANQNTGGQSVIAIQCGDIGTFTTFDSSDYSSCTGCVGTQELRPQWFVNGDDDEAPYIDSTSSDPYNSQGFYSIGDVAPIVSAHDNIFIDKVILSENSTGSFVNHTVYNGNGNTQYGIGSHDFEYTISSSSSKVVTPIWYVFDEAENYNMTQGEDIEFIDFESSTYGNSFFVPSVGSTGDLRIEVQNETVWHIVQYFDVGGDEIIGANCTDYINGTDYQMLYYPEIIDFYGNDYSGYAYDFGSFAPGWYEFDWECSKSGYDTLSLFETYPDISDWYTILSERPILMDSTTDDTRYLLTENLKLTAWYHEDDIFSGNPKVDTSSGICNSTIGGDFYNMTWNPSDNAFAVTVNASLIGEGIISYTASCYHTDYGQKEDSGMFRITDKLPGYLYGFLFYEAETFTEDYFDFCIIYDNEDDEAIEGATCTSEYSTFAIKTLQEKENTTLDMESYIAYGWESQTLGDIATGNVYCSSYSNMGLEPGDEMDIYINCESPEYDDAYNLFTIPFVDVPELDVTLLSPGDGEYITLNAHTIHGSASGCTQCPTGCTIKIGYDSKSISTHNRDSGNYSANFYDIPQGEHTAFLSAECTEAVDGFTGFVRDTADFTIDYGTETDNFTISSPLEVGIKYTDYNLGIIVPEGTFGTCTVTREELRAYVDGDPVTPGIAVMGLTGVVRLPSYDAFGDTQPLLDEIIFEMDFEKYDSYIADPTVYDTQVGEFNITGTRKELLIHPRFIEEYHDEFELKDWSRQLSAFPVSAGSNRKSIDDALIFGDAVSLIKAPNGVMVLEPKYVVELMAGEDSPTLSDYLIDERMINLEAILKVRCVDTSDNYFIDYVTVTTTIYSEDAGEYVKKFITFDIILGFFFFGIPAIFLIVAVMKYRGGK